MINPELLNAYAHDAKHVLSFATLRKCRDPSYPSRSLSRSFYLYLSQCHLLHDLHSLQKVMHWRNRETTKRPIPRTPSSRRRDDKNASKLVARHFNIPNHFKREVEQGGKSPFSLLSEPISPSSLLFEPISPSSLKINISFSPSSLLFPPISPSSQLYLGHFSLLPILFLPPLLSNIWQSAASPTSSWAARKAPKFIFQNGTLNPHGINKHFHSTNYILLFFLLPGTNK